MSYTDQLKFETNRVLEIHVLSETTMKTVCTKTCIRINYQLIME